jgi:hypothetical protein
MLAFGPLEHPTASTRTPNRATLVAAFVIASLISFTAPTHTWHGPSPLRSAGKTRRAARSFGRVASSLALLRIRSFHADAPGRVPVPDLPTVGLVDSLDPRVNGPSARCRVRLSDDFPFAGLVRHAVADLKLHREDLGVARCLRLTLLGGAGQFSPTIEITQSAK